ncbi:hypothetical protein [Nocardia sp. NBC_01329]|uniref:hypothetical protein n=1 Tax=Nocardia sp. NBC_01329 TaxID=2903594 RepID=UPI002E11B515|nr:hypothetical protein OG405_06165 [Nocardia sp. NBC_01329]
MTDAPPPDDEQRIGLDLVAPELYAPVLRRLALVALALAFGIGVITGLLFDVLIGSVAGLVVAVPAVGYAVAVRRRRLWLRGTTITARTLLGARLLDIAALTGVELLVYPGRLSRLVLRLTAGPDRQIIPLAMYTDAGSGRELHLLGLRRLADALVRSELPAAPAVADLLVHQLRAEARDAALTERPLYRAVTLTRAKDYVSPIVLTDQEIATLL